MEISTDRFEGKRVGSHIRLAGRILVLRLAVDEVVEIHDPPQRKEWVTLPGARLLVIDSYRMGFAVERINTGSLLRVFIEYRLPVGIWRGLPGRLLGRMYACWCVRQMLGDAERAFATARTRE